MTSEDKDSVERTGTAGSGQESDKVAAAYQQAIEELKKLSSLECRPPKEKLIELLEIVLFQHNKQKVELDAAQVEIKQLEAENAKLKKDLADFTVSYNKNLRRWVDSANNKAAQVAELEAANSELRTHNTEQRQQIKELEKQLANVDYTASYLKGKKDGEDKLRAEINLFISSYQTKNESGEQAEQPKARQEKTSVQGTGNSLQKVIKLAKDLALGQLQMSEEVWENHVKKGANGILALLGKISSGQAEQPKAGQEKSCLWLCRNRQAIGKTVNQLNQIVKAGCLSIIVSCPDFEKLQAELDTANARIAELKKRLVENTRWWKVWQTAKDEISQDTIEELIKKNESGE